MPKKLPLLVCSLLLLLAAFWSGSSEWHASTFIPFNGHFQNFWSLERMSRGEVPFLDFPVYLGAGHLYAAWPLFELLGGDFRASTAAHNALAGLCLGGSLVVTMRLLGWRWTPTLLCSIALWQVFATMATAWSSVIGFRSTLPIVVAMAVHRLLPARDSTLKRTAGYGFVMGMTPLWSNDYGIPAALAMTLVLLLSWPGYKRAMLAACCALLGLALGATAVSWGHPMAWLDSSIFLPASVQAWYFNPIAENKTYSLLDFPWYDGSFLLGCVCVAALCATWPRRSGTGLGLPPRDHVAVTALVLCALGGFCLSCLGGTYEQRYAMPLWRYMLPVSLTVGLLLLALSPLGRLRQRYSLFSKYPILSGSLSVVLAVMAVGYAEKPFELHISMESAEARGELRPAPSLRLLSWPEVARADAIGRQLKAMGISVGADYSSVVSVASGSHQSSPNYIIHAFGAEAQQRYRTMLDKGSQQRWETLDPDVLAWGLWIVRMAWPLHRDLFLNWYPVDRTAWTLLWKRRFEPLQMKPASCEIVEAGEGRQEVRISGDIPPNQAWWADVGIEVSTTFQRGMTPIAGGTGLIDLVEGDDAPPGADPTVVVSGRWTAPLQNGLIEAPVIVRSGEASRLRLRAWPAGRSSVHVTSCSARLVAPLSATLMRAPPPGPRKLRTAGDLQPFYTKWKEDGIEAVRVITANPYEALSLRRGDRVVLPDGRHATIALRDFGNFAYVPDTPGPWPKPDSEVTILPCPQEAVLGTLVPPLEAHRDVLCEGEKKDNH